MTSHFVVKLNGRASLQIRDVSDKDGIDAYEVLKYMGIKDEEIRIVSADPQPETIYKLTYSYYIKPQLPNIQHHAYLRKRITNNTKLKEFIQAEFGIKDPNLEKVSWERVKLL